MRVCRAARAGAGYKVRVGEGPTRVAVSRRLARMLAQAGDAYWDLWHAGDGMLACPLRVHVLRCPVKIEAEKTLP